MGKGRKGRASGATGADDRPLASDRSVSGGGAVDPASAAVSTSAPAAPPAPCAPQKSASEAEATTLGTERFAREYPCDLATLEWDRIRLRRGKAGGPEFDPAKKADLDAVVGVALS